MRPLAQAMRAEARQQQHGKPSRGTATNPHLHAQGGAQEADGGHHQPPLAAPQQLEHLGGTQQRGPSWQPIERALQSQSQQMLPNNSRGLAPPALGREASTSDC